MLPEQPDRLCRRVKRKPMFKPAIVVAAVLVASPAFAQTPLTTAPEPTAGDLAVATSQESRAETTPNFA